MTKITIIGSGNVAHHLISTFQDDKSIEIVQVFARKKGIIHHNIINNEKIISDFSDFKEADLYIISVSDDAIFEVSESLPFSEKLVVHTSGTKSIDFLSDKNRKGVFYPLQSFSKDKKLNFKEIPICIEAIDKKDFDLLKKIAQSISNSVIEMDSQKRKALHLASVFVCNFVNYMYRIGNEICKENDIHFDILKPLIKETADKINYISSDKAQTGPAQRGDMKIINAHLDFLKNNTENKKIYKLITQAILKKNEKL